MKVENPLPNLDCLPGAVCVQFVTRGDKRWGPYFYRFWREGGKLRKVYVRRSEVMEVLRCCEMARQRRQSVAQMIRESNQVAGRVHRIARSLG